MRVSGELFVLVNTLANGLSLWLAARLLGVPPAKWRCLVRAALLGTGYGVAAFVPELSFLRAAPLAILTPLAMAKLMLPRVRLLLVCKAAALILLGGLLLGGLFSWLVAQGLTPWASFLALFVLMAAAAFLCGLHIKVPAGVTMVEIGLESVSLCPEPIRLSAMLDTGNQLTDPITGLPVVVVSSLSLRPLLPASIRPEDPRTLPLGFRFLRVQTTAGQRLMMCFRPSHFRVRLEGAWHDSQVLIAIAPTGYDGAQALVPAKAVEAL